MTPGNYGDFPPPGVDTLSAGIYCINGDFFVNGGRLEGNGVIIKMEQGRLRFSGTAEINLSAPKKGDLAGLLIYQPPDNQNMMVLNGGDDSSFLGTILAPSAPIRFKGLGEGAAFHSQIVGYTIAVAGDRHIVIKSLDDQNYAALTLPEVQVVQ